MSIATFWPGIQGAAGPGFAVGFTSDPYSIFDIGTFPANARSVVEIRANGDIWRSRLNNSNGAIGVWVSGAGFDPLDYDFQWLDNGVDPNWVSSNAIDTWFNGIALPLQWGHQGTGVGTAVGILQIRPAGGGATIDSANTSLSYESLP